MMCLKGLILILCATFSFQTVNALDGFEHEAILHIVSKFQEGWNHSSAKELAEHYEENADFVNIFGMLLSGKKEIEVRHDKILSTFMKGSTFEITDQQLREVAPNLVIAHVWWKVSDIPPSDKIKSSIEGIFSHVFIKNNEGWKITSTHNTLKP